MAGNSNPLQEFMNAVRSQTYTPSASLTTDTMWDALNTIGAYIRMNDIERTELLSATGNVFTVAQGRRYSELRDAAHIFIIELPRYVTMVEYAN